MGDIRNLSFTTMEERVEVIGPTAGGIQLFIVSQEI
jgi:hypothetical protein